MQRRVERRDWPGLEGTNEDQTAKNAFIKEKEGREKKKKKEEKRKKKKGVKKKNEEKGQIWKSGDE